MTTPTLTPAQQAPDKMTAPELRQAFHHLQNDTDEIRASLEMLRAELAQIREGLSHASQPAPAASTDGENFTAVRIVREMRKKKYYYKMQGGKDTKFGVTIWDEVLEALGLDKVEYDEDDIHKLTPPMEVHVSFEWYTDENGEQKKRRKVTGRA